jgi:Mg-chelatase subunit ChlD
LLLWVSLLAGAPPRDQGLPIRIPLWAGSAEPLEQDELSIKVDGKPAKIVRIQGPQEALLLLVVVDLVSDLNEIDLAREAMISALSQMPANAHIGLLRAQDGLRVLLDPTSDRDELTKAIQSFTTTGAPGLLETIEQAFQLADSVFEKAPVRTALCYVTDSNIYEYREDFSNPVINYTDSRDLSRRFPEGLVRDRIAALDAKLSMRQTPLFIVHLEYRPDRLNEAYQNGLMQLASTTGGQAIFCRSNSEIATAVGGVFRSISEHYGVDIQLPANTAEMVTIAVESAKRNVHYRSRFRIKR